MTQSCRGASEDVHNESCVMYAEDFLGSGKPWPYATNLLFGKCKQPGNVPAGVCHRWNGRRRTTDMCQHTRHIRCMAVFKYVCSGLQLNQCLKSVSA